MELLVAEAQVGRGVYDGGVTSFPVWTSAPGVRGMRTGAGVHVGVAERAGSPVVDELVVTNEGAHTVLLLEGELLEGGWQHRTLVRDQLLAPHTSRAVTVACVEQGRWSGSPEHRHGARRTSPSVRSAVGQDEDTRQSAVWSRVGRYEAALGSSPTGSLLDHLDGLTEGVGRHGAALLPGQRGVILGVGGQPLVLEMFGSRAALAAHLPALLAAVFLDAALIPPSLVGQVPGRRARRMAAHLAGVPLAGSAADPGAGDIGVGTNLTAHTTHATVTGIATPAGGLAHLSALNTRHPLLVAA